MSGSSLNRVTLIGNLGADPEVRTTADGRRIVRFSVATTERWKDASGARQERTEWHRVAIFSPGLGRVDGFNQHQPACKTDDGGVADVGLFAAHGDAFEPLELADGLFDARPEFIETLGKEAASLLGVFTTRDHRM